MDAGGFAFGAEALYSLARGGTAGADDASVDAVGDVPSAFAPGSLILLLENIVCSLNVDHRINGFSADT